MRYALGIEYDGGGFYGWQTQRQTPTVQRTLEQALSRVADHAVSVVCAGRTDAGVHANCQVAHFDSDAVREERSWVLGVNSNLPSTVSVLWVRQVDDSFHARFSALARSYRYVILNRWVRPALDAGRVGWQRRRLDAPIMHAAAQSLTGENDFTSFRSSGCRANHPVREVHSITVSRTGDRIRIDVTANGFLYHMVRNIVGTLVPIGLGEQGPDWAATVLAAKSRALAGVTAVPDGLYFDSVRYPEEFGLPERPISFPRFNQLR